MILTRRDLRSTGLVAALSSGFGVALLQGAAVLVHVLGEYDVATHERMKVALTVVAATFFAIAVFVGAIVTSNTVRTVIAGRTIDIARLRLLGAETRSIRRGFVRSGLFTASISSTFGAAIVAAVGALTVLIAVNIGALPSKPYNLFSAQLLAPVIATIAVCAVAVLTGSRAVLGVAPVEAAGAAAVGLTEPRSRAPLGIVLIIVGIGCLVLGIVIGRETPWGLPVAVPGGMLSFGGVILCADRFLPAVLRAVGSLFTMGAATRLAAANAVREPGRSSRAVIGVVIGVTLIVMFSVAMETYYDVLFGAQSAFPDLYADSDSALSFSIVVFSLLFGFSALIAAVGLVNTLSQSVLQRRRELGLLRSIGLTGRQVRVMILTESMTMGVSAVIVGFALGIGYGWSGAMALLGSIPGGQFVVPVVPLWLLIAVPVATVALCIGAAIMPTRRVLRGSPIAALAVA
ncbi:FtsX-like permease family protein [Microbacterium sp. MPKO10]|uniref:ABC transporter permease n=1 Tax=Microbacterium sp. MPKO10 TaxID=2989818 RepID=UPI002235766F|nr:FtsX-like permease family protein [Microbacterium sp. MPKO10]MCW4459644.1 FtsX-like permease family protein [Microbacterium sp. MPKO10]